jgi:hypothetical protein
MTPEQHAKLLDQYVRIAIGNLVIDVAALRAENDLLKAQLQSLSPPVPVPSDEAGSVHASEEGT